MDRFLVFDGNSILNRAFYGVRPLTNKEGFPTNALFGFVNIIRKNLSEKDYTYAAIAYDLPAPTFRHKASETYKATRKGMPEDLAKQLPVSKEIAKAMGLHVLECEGFEADDIIGTVSRIAAEQGAECFIVTGDRDSYQLVSDKVTVLLAATKETRVITPDALREAYGLEPLQMIDLKAIMGDSSDNIKGVAGIGEKGALTLMHEYGSLDAIYEHIDEIKGSVHDKLVNGRDDAYASRFLAEIVKNAPIPESTGEYRLGKRDDAVLFPLFTKLEFSNLLNSLDISEPVTKREAAAVTRVASADMLSAEAPELFVALSPDSSSVEIYDGTSVCEIPFDTSTAKLLSAEGRRVCFWSSKDAARKVLDMGIGFDCEYDDVSLMAYIVSQTDGGLTPDKALLTYLGISSAESLAAMLPELREKLLPLMNESEKRLYGDIEKPLAKLLAKIEHTGFGVDPEGLAVYGKALEKEMSETAESIYSLAGHEFNINSPKQLQTVLFDELMLPHYGKTQSGYSTAADVLEKLADYHPIIERILYYRKAAKLKSTYCDGLLAAVSPSDGRVHTTFRQTLTKTGRLSSTEPNLQNIPVRTAEGRELRRFFTAKPGYVLVDADYSQIELRILAHISGDTHMCEAFRNGADIHTSTAARVFGVPENSVTSDMRKRAKAVNFGIVYGISDFSLGQDIGISKRQAADYIRSYLDNYPGVRDYLGRVKEEAVSDGFVTTLFGRKRYIPELRSSKKSLVSFGERVAMNTPIQGTAADIIKKAMIDADRIFAEKGVDAKIIMQIHDELIIEVPESEAQAAEKLLVGAMENAYPMSVPLTADVGTGKTWFEAKD